MISREKLSGEKVPLLSSSISFFLLIELLQSVGGLFSTSINCWGRKRRRQATLFYRASRLACEPNC